MARLRGVANGDGGIWRTDNAGGDWTPVDDFMANLSTTSLVMDPNDSDLIYAGKVDHGFDRKSADDLRKRLTPLIRKTQPYTRAKWRARSVIRSSGGFERISEWMPLTLQ